jgi:hypothetical protein
MPKRLKWSSSDRPALIRDAAAIAGAGLVCAGLWSYSVGFALIWSGAVIIAVAIALEAKAHRSNVA